MTYEEALKKQLAERKKKAKQDEKEKSERLAKQVAEEKKGKILAFRPQDRFLVGD